MGRKASPNKNDFSTQLEEQEKNIALLKKEIQIEAALEKVRAHTMAMHQSEELGDVVKVLYQEFKVLGMADWGCAIMIFDKEANQIEYWVSEATNSDLSCFYVKGQENSVYQKLWKHWEKQGESLNLHHTDEFKKEFDTYWLNETDFKRLPEAVKESVYADREIFLTFSTMQYGMLNATGKTKLSEGQIKVLERFAKVFEQTYTRFLDLQKAEAQAREARIETALEKIRSSMMAMHQSDELRMVVATMYDQLQNLGFDSSASMINIYNDDLSSEQWMAGFLHGELPKSYHIPYCDHPYFTEEVSGWQEGLPFHELIFEGPQKVEYGKWMIEHSDYKFLPAEFHQEMLSPERIYISNAHMKYGLVEAWGTEPLPEKSITTLIRFAKVFEQTYTRFLDLQKAEVQAREAEIQLALERVRARAMAMHQSQELGEVAIILYKEFNALNIADFFNCGFIIINETEGIQNGWMTQPEGSFIEEMNLPYPGDELIQRRAKAWKEKIPVHHDSIGGENFKRHKKYVSERSKSASQVNTVMPFMPDPCHFYCGNFEQGYLHIVTKEELREEDVEILSRFTKVFEQTYTRFLDLQKAEAQAREAQIEAALERVRARTMAMQKSEELLDLVKKIYSEIEPFGVSTTGIAIALFREEENAIENWFADNLHSDLLQSYKVVGQKNKVFKQIWEDWKNKNPQRKMYLEGPDKRGYDNYILTETDFRQLPEELKEEIHSHKSVCFTFTYFKYGYFESVDLTIPAEENAKILLRFAKVFEQTYTRFLDLQKAEAQTKEAEIELALERIRARTMAMHHSDELIEVVKTLTLQFLELKPDMVGNWLSLVDIESNSMKIIGSNGDLVNEYIVHGSDRVNYQHDIDAYKKGVPHWQFSLPKEVIFEIWRETLDFEDKDVEIPEGVTEYHLLHIRHAFGFFGFGSWEKADEETIAILSRFCKVFEQTYTRFLDLQKAEAQAREAEIELALERVRAKTMAMQKSDELSDVAALLFKQIKILGAELWTISIAFCKEDELMVEKWGGSPITDQIFAPNFIPYNVDHGEQSMYNTWKNKVELYSYVQEGKVLKDIYDHLMTIPSFKANFQKVIDAGRPLPVWQKNHVASFKYGYLLVITEEEFKEEYVFTRFAKVFEQTYTRFLDLQKAEAQTREAQIEASMERIRSRSLAIRTSDEIKDVMVEIRRQIDSLGQLDLEASVVHLYEKGNPMFESIAAVRPPGESGNIVLANVFFPVDATDRIKDMMDYYWSDTREYTLELDKEMVEEWQQVMLTHAPTIAERRGGFVENRRISDFAVYWNFADFSEGSLLLVTHSPASEDTKTVLRKASQVFDLAYRRYRDLQKAEARAKEAIRQASLDRVRGEIASMRSTEDLNRITPLIWNELTALGVSFIRCGVFIIDEKSEMVDIYLSSPDGKSLGVMKLPFNSNDLSANTVKAWKKDCVYHQFWSRDAFISWTNSLVSQGFISDKEKYQGNQEAPPALNLNFIPFTQGMLYVGTAEELPNSEVELVKSLAKAFALAYSRYEDFVKLEMAKSEIESTLSELKATQAQLIQQEKLASLGQLTAGIAHEIKNPLNFVTNFSDVSIEMIDEALEELGQSTQDDHTVETAAIMSDIRSNLFKIHEHGSRADGIVKSMLQHSRGGDGKMEPSPLNPIIKEYVNLAFHGMRASKEPINVDIDLQLDESIGNVALVAEDFSRVILNLCNNAFDAMRDKETQNSESKIQNYTPKLMVRTGSDDGKVIIEVHDNGPGIPDEIIDKILQPFFTTKKGTQGTGLGLSITNDIVKAHGGSLDVYSQPGETVFTIKING